MQPCASTLALPIETISLNGVNEFPEAGCHKAVVNCMGSVPWSLIREHCRLKSEVTCLGRMASRFDDDDEVMRFEVTEEDLAEEAGGFMGAGRGPGRQSKEQVLFNI